MRQRFFEIMTTIPKIYRLGERHTAGILDGTVVVEEKYDGSQFSFNVAPDAYSMTGALMALICRSKSTVIDQENPGMFKLAVESAHRCFKDAVLSEGWTYQCEFLAKPKHNVLTYGRVPKGNLVLFDVIDSSGEYLDVAEKERHAMFLGLEVVARLWHGQPAPTADFSSTLLHLESSLGGCKIEGFVLKNYSKSHGERPGHPMTAKVVSDKFKEKVGFKAHPKGEAGFGPIGEKLTKKLRTEARWLKAVQHLREQGVLKQEAKDIGPLIAELQTDLLAEESDWIKQELFAEFKQGILRGVVQGFAQWYLGKLTSGWTVFKEVEILNKQDTNKTNTNE
jgi:hypothetical protein